MTSQPAYGRPATSNASAVLARLAMTTAVLAGWGSTSTDPTYDRYQQVDDPRLGPKLRALIAPRPRPRAATSPRSSCSGRMLSLLEQRATLSRFRTRLASRSSRSLRRLSPPRQPG